MASRGTVHRGGVHRGHSEPSAPAPPTHDDDDDDDGDSDGWEDGEVEDWDEPEHAPTRSLFTDQEFASPAECLAHAASCYALDIPLLIRRLQLDLYDRMRIVNYLRTTVRTPGADVAALVAAVVACQPGALEPWPWSDDTYLQPVLADDPLLYSLSMEDEEVDEAEEQADAMEAVGALHETVALMRQEMRAVLSSLDDAPAAAAASDDDDNADADKAAAVSAQEPAEGAAAAAGPAEGEYGTQSVAAGSSYFGSYSRLGIHQEMLQDVVRTEAYREAIMGNAALFAGKVVLDVGCGTGILSLFAARAGAKLVIGVDASDILQSAQRVVDANGMQDRIKLVQGTLETISLPEGVTQVDIIISEWMGYLLLYESMLPSVLYARDKWLTPGGLLLPSSCELRISASSHDRYGFWREVYGFDMGSVRDEARRDTLADASVELVPAASLLSTSEAFRAVHIAQVKDGELDFTTDFALSASAAGPLRCFAVHFDTLFDLSASAGGQRTGFSTGFSTGPECTPTHWKQVALYLEPPRELVAGDRVSGSISCARRADNKRAYDVSVTFAINGAACGTQLWRVC